MRSRRRLGCSAARAIAAADLRDWAWALCAARRCEMSSPSNRSRKPFSRSRARRTLAPTAPRVRQRAAGSCSAQACTRTGCSSSMRASQGSGQDCINAMQRGRALFLRAFEPALQRLYERRRDLAIPAGSSTDAFFLAPCAQSGPVACAAQHTRASACTRGVWLCSHADREHTPRHMCERDPLAR